MVVGRIVYDGKMEVVENLRLPVRLGQDVFTTGIISEEIAQLTVDTFIRFRRIADNHKVGKSARLPPAPCARRKTADY